MITMELLLQHNAWGGRREKWDAQLEEREPNKGLRKGGVGEERPKWGIKLRYREDID